MRRALAAVMTAAFLFAMLPGVAAAARSSRFSETYVLLFCEGARAGVFIESSTEFGTTADAAAWFGNDDPFEDPPTISGFTDTIDVAETDTAVQVGFGFTAFDAEGDEAGEGSFTSDLTVVRESTEPDPAPDGNHKSRIDIVRKFVEGEGTITARGRVAEVSCNGEVTHRTVWANNPTSSVVDQSGVNIECVWETENYFAVLFAGDSGFGFFLEVAFFSRNHAIFSTGELAGSIDGSGIDASAELFDEATGQPASVEVTADFGPDGSPVTSRIRQQGRYAKLVEQLLSVDGSLELSTGKSLRLNDRKCNTVAFDVHARSNGARGPQATGPVPANDRLRGAIALDGGDRVNVQTRATRLESEMPRKSCFGNGFGHTVWYTFEGTGRPVTIDTKGSAIDTVLSVYLLDADGLVEVTCADDVFKEPLGVSLQAAATLDTDSGATYAIQVGGFWSFFSDQPEFGRISLSIT
jgi:hypothetical protein